MRPGTASPAPRAPALWDGLGSTLATRIPWSTLAAVGGGGILGANARYQLGEWIITRWGTTFPWGTLLVNLSGSLVLGFYLTLATERFTARPLTRLFVATGFLGGYTTFSTFSYEAMRLLQAGEPVRALLYVTGSLLAGIAAVIAGAAAARALSRPPGSMP